MTAARQGLDERAARLAGASMSLCGSYHMPRQAIKTWDWDGVLEQVEDRFSTAAFRAAWAAGAALSLAEAMAEAAMP